MSDLSDNEDDTQPVSPGGTVTPRVGKKRANHNELERKRRQHQKDQLNSLKEAVPALKQDKTSTVLILSKAKEYIDALTRRVTDNESELIGLREKANEPAKPPDKLIALAMASQSLSMPITIKHEDYDVLKQENSELRKRLEVLEKQILIALPSSSPAIKRDRLSPPLLSLSPSIGAQPSPATAVWQAPMPELDRANAMASLAAVATAEVVTREVAINRTMNNNNGLHPHSYETADHPYHFRKRKSYADNDFEAAKQDYYSQRRNSSYDILKQYQQRVNESEAGLFQNFVVQARRASVPSAFMDGMPPPMLADAASPVHDDDDDEVMSENED